MTGRSRPERQIPPALFWEFLLVQTTLYAAGHINRWLWRGSPHGVLPDGYDPRSIAAQAIAEFLQNSRPDPQLTRHHLNRIRRGLELRVRRHVNRLYHRAENRLVRNEPDLAPVTIDDGESVRIIEMIPEPSRKPDESLLEIESLARFEATKSRFSLFLGPQSRLGHLFELLCDDVEKPHTLASRLKLRVRTVHHLRRQLKGRWQRCFGTHHPG